MTLLFRTFISGLQTVRRRWHKLWLSSFVGTALFALSLSAVSWLLLAGPLRETPLAELDQSIADAAMRIGADHRANDGPTLFLLDYDQSDWTSAGMPAQLPLTDLIAALNFARASAPRVVMVDLALSAREKSATGVASDAAVIAALQAWDKDPAAPLLLIADSSGTGWFADPAFASEIGPLRKVALVSAVLGGSGGEVRFLETWTCIGANGTPAASPVAYLAALDASGSASAAKQLVDAQVRAACANRAPLQIGHKTFKALEPIFFHLSGRPETLSTTAGRPALVKLSFSELHDVLGAQPGSRQCPGRLVFLATTCDSILIIGATHSASPDRYATPLSALTIAPGNSNQDDLMAGALIIGNAMRGYAVFGLASDSGIARGAALIALSLPTVFILFVAWQLPYRRILALRDSPNSLKRHLATQSWLFGPIVAKFVATTIWGFVLLIWYYSSLRFAFGPGLVVASYAPALAFTILEVQQLERHS